MPTANRRFITTAVVATILITVLGGLLNRALTDMKAAPATAGPRAPSIAVTTIVARRQAYQERLVGYGRARPLTVSEVSAGVAGDVVWRAPQLEPGNFVEAGTELVRIDDRDLRSAVAAARARLTQAQSLLRQREISLARLRELKQIASQEHETSQRTHQRREELYRSATISNEDYDLSLLQHSQRQRALLELQQQEELATPEIESAAAELTASEAALAQAETELDRSVVRAPYAGFVDERLVHLGVRVAAGTQLFRMIDTSEIELPIALPASHYSAVRAGSPAVVRLRENGAVVWEGEVARVSPRIDDPDRTFFAFLLIAAEPDRQPVPAGAFVVAEIDASEYSDVLVVPRTALVGGELYVAVPQNDEAGSATIESRKPAIVRLLTDVALLSDGVAAGERIVVTNVEKVGHGSSVLMIDRQE